jgi:hypothetical protein
MRAVQWVAIQYMLQLNITDVRDAKRDMLEMVPSQKDPSPGVFESVM